MSLIPDDLQIKTRINMNPAVFLSGKRKEAIAELKRVFDLAKQYCNTTVGSLIPYEADSNIIKDMSKLILSL